MAERESRPETFRPLPLELLKKSRIRKKTLFISQVPCDFLYNRIKLIFYYQHIVHLIVIIFLSSFFISTTSCSKKVSQNNLQKIESLYEQKKSRTPIEEKISSQLLQAIKKEQNPSEEDVTNEPKTLLEIDEDGRVMVDIKADITPELIEEIEHLGGIIIHSSKKFNSIRARIHLNQIKAVARMEEVIFIRPAIMAITH